MKYLLCLLMMCIVTLPAFAQRDKDPTAKEIAGKSARIKLDNALSASGAQGAKRVKVIPVVAPSKTGIKELEEGQIIGELEARGNVDHMPNGKHHIFVAKVNNVWQAYAVSGGKIVAKSKSVTVESSDAVRKKPEIQFNLSIVVVWACRGRDCIVIVIAW